MMKDCIKADFMLLLNQATLFGGWRSLLIPTGLPVISNTSPCYRITGRMAFKPLIEKDNISNKLAKNGPKSFFLPVLSLFRADNREKPPFSASSKSVDIRAWRLRSKSWFTQRRKGAKGVHGRIALRSYRQSRAMRDEEERRISLPRNTFAPLRLCENLNSARQGAAPGRFKVVVPQA